MIKILNKKLKFLFSLPYVFHWILGKCFKVRVLLIEQPNGRVDDLALIRVEFKPRKVGFGFVKYKTRYGETI